MKKLNIFVSSNMGLVRSNNEDMVLAGAGTYRDDDWRGTGIMLSSKDHYAVAVCDGMGGQNAGEVASEDVATQLRKMFLSLPCDLDTEDLTKRICEWQSDEHEYLLQRGNDEEELRGMGTTLVSWFIYQDRIFWMNCGDSRIYRFREGKLTQLSKDHSLFSITHDPKDSHIVLNCMGGGCPNSYIDIIEITDTHKPNDLYILCSDGLSDMITDPEIENVLANGGRATELTSAACEAGGFDNVSVCVVELI